MGQPLVTLPPFPLREARGGQRLMLSTLHEEEYEFRSPSSVAVAELVAMFLEGLKERSVFAMALQDRKATGTQPGGEGAGEGGRSCGWWEGGLLVPGPGGHEAGGGQGLEQREGERPQSAQGHPWARPSLLQDKGVQQGSQPLQSEGHQGMSFFWKQGESQPGHQPVQCTPTPQPPLSSVADKDCRLRGGTQLVQGRLACGWAWERGEPWWSR